jgi:hypothetical protein
LIEIVIKVIGHKRTDMRVKRLFYNMDSVLARAGGIFLQPEQFYYEDLGLISLWLPISRIGFGLTSETPFVSRGW